MRCIARSGLACSNRPTSIAFVGSWIWDWLSATDPGAVGDKGCCPKCGYVADLIVGGSVVIEIKSVSELHPIHEAQLISYLKLTGCRVGLLINFNWWSYAGGRSAVARTLVPKYGCPGCPRLRQPISESRPSTKRPATT